MKRDLRTRERLFHQALKVGSGWAERGDVVDRARELFLWRRSQAQQRVDRLGHGHERNPGVWPHKAVIRLALRHHMDHLWTVVTGATRRNGVTGNDPRKSDGTKVDRGRMAILGKLSIMRLVVTTKFLTRQLVDAVHGVRVRELIFIHYRMRALISKRWHSVRSNRTWEHEFHALTVTARLLCSKLEQVERAAHIHMMCSLWRKFTAR